ncbi:MAG: hypothetical protein AAGE94_13080 [Acidobacteriota bacterium]
MPAAGHLDAIRVDPQGVLDVALATFERAEAGLVARQINAA